MSRILIDGAQRAVLFQRATGNVLDIGTRQMQRIRVVEEEKRTDTAQGGKRARRRRRKLLIESPDAEIVRFARQMRRIGCPVQALILGADTHATWAEPVRLDVKQNEHGQTGSVVGSSLRLDCHLYEADIEAGRDLLAGVPWDVSEVEISDTLAKLSDRSVSRGDAVDITSSGGGDAGLKCVVGAPDIYEMLSGNVADFTVGLEDLRGIAHDGSGYLVIENQENEIAGVNTSVGTVSYHNGNDTLGSAAYQPRSGDDRLFVVNETQQQVDVLMRGSLGTLSDTIFPQDSTTPVSLLCDEQEEQLLIGTSGGRIEVWDVSGTQLEWQYSYGTARFGLDTLYNVARGADAMTYHEGALYMHDTTASAVDVASRWRLGVPGTEVWRGRAWRVRRSVTVDVTGAPSGITVTYPARLRMIAPLVGATITLAKTTGALDALAWNGTELNINDSSRIGDPPQLTLEGGKYSGLGIDATSIWPIDLRADDVAARPELQVDDPGTALGARRGGVVNDCQTRVESPAWGTVEAVAFDWEADAGDQLSIQVTDAAGKYIGQISGEGEQVKGTSATFTAENAGTYTAELVAEAFEGITKITIDPSKTQAKIQPNLSTLFGSLPDLVEVRLSNILPTGEPTEKDLEGLEVINARSSFSYQRGGSAVIYVGRLDSTIQDVNFRATGWGVQGDWGNVASGAYPNLTRLRFADGSNVYLAGTLTGLLQACTGLETLIEVSSASYLYDVDPSVSDFQAAPSTLSEVRLNSRGNPFSGQMADFDDPDIPARVAWEFTAGLANVNGDLGDLPTRNGGPLGWKTSSQANADSLTADAYTPSDYTDWSLISLTEPGMTEAGADTLAARAANGASHLNGQPTGYTLSLVGGGRGQSGSAGYLNNYPPPQHPYRALGVKPNVSWNLGGTIDTSGWNDSWAVSGNVSYPSSSEITVDKPTSDSASDTKTDDGNAVPTDSTLPDANGGSGAILHIFEDDPNATGPLQEANSTTEYIVDSVTDNGDGTITFTLDTTNGPPISDTGSSDLDVNTRIAVTW